MFYFKEKNHFIVNMMYGLIVILLMFSITTKHSHAAKIKSASSSLENIKSAANILVKDIDNLKKVMGSVTRTGSFISTDFWGTTPHWYRNGEGGHVTTRYPFDSYAFWQGSLKKISYQRKVGTVSLYGINDNRSSGAIEYWNVIFVLDFDEFFNSKSGYGSRRTILRSLKENGIPEGKLQPALNYYYRHYKEMKAVLFGSVIKKFDSLFENVLIGWEELSKSKKNLIPLFGDKLNVPSAHKSIMDKLEQEISIQSWPNMVGCRDHKTKEVYTLEDCLSKRGGMTRMSLIVEAVSHKFEIAPNMNQSFRYSQLMDLEYLLDGAIEKGDAVLEVSGGINHYRDTKSNGAYRGSFDIDLNSGKGVWRTPIWESKKDLNQVKGAMVRDEKKLHDQIKNYLDATLIETVKKFTDELRNSNNAPATF